MKYIKQIITYLASKFKRRKFKRCLAVTQKDYAELAQKYKLIDIPHIIGFDKVKIRYADWAIKEFHWIDWLPFRDNIVNNLYNKNKCWIRFYLNNKKI